MSLLHEFHEQRRRRPQIRTEPLAELPDALEDAIETDGIRVVERATTVRGETVAIKVNDIHIARPLRDALTDDFQPFVRQPEDQPVDNLGGVDIAPGNAEFVRRLIGDLLDLGVGKPAAGVRIVLVEPGAGLLPEPASLGLTGARAFAGSATGALYVDPAGAQIACPIPAATAFLE